MYNLNMIIWLYVHNLLNLLQFDMHVRYPKDKYFYESLDYV